jgi:hypothetical protein
VLWPGFDSYPSSLRVSAPAASSVTLLGSPITPLKWTNPSATDGRTVGHHTEDRMALSNLLLLRLHRNRRTCYNLAGLGIEDLHYLSMIAIVERTRLRPPAQLFQPLSHLIPAHFASITTFTVWTVDSQEGQQVAHPISLVHDPPRRIRVIRLSGCCVPWGNCSSGRRDVLCHRMRAAFR